MRAVTVEAIDNDTFQLTGSLGGFFGEGETFITLELSDIDWGGAVGSIDDVIFTAGDEGTFGLDSFTSDTITISGVLSCGGINTACPITGANLGTYDLVVTHVPLPAALPLFGSALAMLGIVGWRRRRQAGA